MKLHRKTWIITGAALLLLLVAGTAGAASKDAAKADTSWKFHDIVDVNFVKQYVKVPAPADVMVVDSRPKRAKYDKGHIPMAVSIPHSKFDKMTDKLPKNKNGLLIFYCGGPT
jgi:hypothetical protein